jgi:AraC-like DNA-binding protein
MDNIARSAEIRLVWTSHHWWPPGAQLQHPTACHALWLVQNGQVEVRSKEQCWNVQAGELFFCPPLLWREMSTREGAEWFSIGWYATVLEHFDALAALGTPRLWRPAADDWTALSNCATQLVAEWLPEPIAVEPQTIAAYTARTHAVTNSRSADDLAVCESLARLMFTLCWRRLNDGRAHGTIGGTTPSWLLSCLQSVREDPSISVEQLARNAGFSGAQFRRNFHRYIGVAPRDYLVRQRLEFSRRLLETTELPVSSISMRSGFASQSHFSHSFRQVHGITPARYRVLAQYKGV